MSTPRRAAMPAKTIERPRPSSSAMLAAPARVAPSRACTMPSREGREAAREIEDHEDQREPVWELVKRRHEGVKQQLAHEIKAERRDGGTQQRPEAAEGGH